MDLETENRIASILLKEAAELRRRAEKEGVHSYLNKPNVRARPNSRFLTATVLGVQQANRAVEINELWRARQREQDLEKSLRKGSNSKSESRNTRIFEPCSGKNKEPFNQRQAQTYTEDLGLRDEELEEFLHSKGKRGRGCIGPRMDETGPYLESLLEPSSSKRVSQGMLKKAKTKMKTDSRRSTKHRYKNKQKAQIVGVERQSQ